MPHSGLETFCHGPSAAVNRLLSPVYHTDRESIYVYSAMGVSDAARTREIACCGSCDLLPVDQYFITSSCCGFVVRLIMPRHQGGGQFGIARSVRLSVPWRSCLGYRYAGCLQLSYRRPPEMCGLRPSADGRRSAAIFATVELPSAAAGAYRLADPGAIPCSTANTRKIEARSLSM